MKSETGNPRFTRRPDRAGFTLVELLVAVSITAMMILAISRIFDSVGKAVSRGQAASSILADSRIAGDQLERDFRHMAGPSDGGVLVIVSQAINDVPLNEREPNDLPPDLQRRRSDQLVFIRHRAEAEPITPGGSGDFNSDSQAAYIRVWYGHGLRTDPNDDGRASGRLGDAGSVNEYAGDWIFARQGLFLEVASTSDAKADGAWADAALSDDVLGWDGSPQLYMGLTTIAEYGLTTEDDGNSSADIHGAMVGGPEPPDDQDNPPHNRQRRLWSDLPPDEYSSRLYDYLYLDDKRLWVNPDPVMDANDGYASWQIAQMHPYLAGHVSHIQVDFAGDYDDDSDEIDTDDEGQIIWYGMNSVSNGDDTDDFDEDAFANPDDDDPNATGQKPILDDRSPTDVRFIFRHGSAKATNWPRLIRFRYRIHDEQGLISGPDGLPGRSFEQIMRVVRQ